MHLLIRDLTENESFFGGSSSQVTGRASTASQPLDMLGPTAFLMGGPDVRWCFSVVGAWRSV